MSDVDNHDGTFTQDGKVICEPIGEGRTYWLRRVSDGMPLRQVGASSAGDATNALAAGRDMINRSEV